MNAATTVVQNAAAANIESRGKREDLHRISFAMATSRTPAHRIEPWVARERVVAPEAAVDDAAEPAGCGKAGLAIAFEQRAQGREAGTDGACLGERSSVVHQRFFGHDVTAVFDERTERIDCFRADLHHAAVHPRPITSAAEVSR